jgi:hypothetical protein
MSMARLGFFLAIFLLPYLLHAQSCTVSNAASSINWTNASAITCVEGGNLSTKSVLIIPAGKTIVFNDVADTWTGTRIEVNGTLRITADVTINASLEIKSGGLVELDKKLDLGTSPTNPTGCNYTVVIRSGGTLDVGPTGTDRLSVCGTLLMKGNGACNDCGGTNSGTCAYNGQPYCEPSGGFTGPLGFDKDGSNSALPITLKYFSASLVNDAVQVEWATEKEEDFNYFEIQRGNEIFNFTLIGTVPGAGYNTETLQRYSFVDNNPLIDISYYRLKAVDLDGSYEFFRPVSVTNTAGRKISVAPNPVRGNVIRYTINFEPLVNDRVILMDAIGNEIQGANVPGTENELVIDQSLKPGTYLLRYNSTTFQKVIRVFVTN